jgi:hypothetical protein
MAEGGGGCQLEKLAAFLFLRGTFFRMLSIQR